MYVPALVATEEAMVLPDECDRMTFVPTAPTVVHVTTHDVPAVHSLGADVVMVGFGGGSETTNRFVMNSTAPVLLSLIFT